MPHIKINEALYIILRRYDSSTPAPFVVITYVPDAAPVRSKMLFASTRLTLVRELGIERFRETIFATSTEDLSPAGFEKHDKHVLLDAPLTEEEKCLGEVKRREAEESRGMMERKSHIISGLSMPASREVIMSLNGLGKFDVDEATATAKVNLVQLKINSETETLELDHESVTPVDHLATTISSKDPRFSLYRYMHTHNGESISPIFFIYTCPTSSKIKERMLYAASSRSVQQLAESYLGLPINKKVEESNPMEITENLLRDTLYPPVEVTKRFDRPRKPGASRIAR
ncbi:Twinfilin [Golovinomyces cichoracearum]|uniref:Twinfilin n=1 Tax=Golovinomyces cichoracearum TaxID=62708 RepID=A0A420IP63_9PEZI|nr:Twinfilin [Golovinomyces cichoracearum]